ncbi:hypothetical protein F5148DRAFT_1215944 [Russula earlei]|uniref:Uncharacterized protein n=1 Tax=Russula earlei TaxID=71964 RepID=A0ACC0U398_9AGAM|nr:hypothetical protein F5148DRAFT_1215944 [Russula earlei]
MANNVSQGRAPEIVVGVVKVTGPVGRSLIDTLWDNLSTDRQRQQGDYYMDLSRGLLQRHLKLIQIKTQFIIRGLYDEVQQSKGRLNNNSGSKISRLILARKYRKVSEHTYMFIKDASDRVIDNNLMVEFPEATNGSGVRPENDVGTDSFATAQSNLFSDSRVGSTLTVNDLGEIEIHEGTGDAPPPSNRDVYQSVAPGERTYEEAETQTVSGSSVTPTDMFHSSKEE